LQVTHRVLDTGWKVREVPREGASPTTRLDWLPALVPGHIHLDLERTGVIPDPFHRMHERDVAWVDECDWVYETAFDVAEPPAHAYLRFNGLDTIAEIELNDELLGRSENMFIPHEFAVGGKLRMGSNSLRVTFRSALHVGYERQKAWDAAGNDTTKFHWFNWGPRSFVRKAQYMYGWDWGPELVSCGIWRPVELITVPTARLLDWKYDVEFTSGNKAVVMFEAEIERSPDALRTPLSLNVDFQWVSGLWDQSLEGLPEPVSVDVPTGEKHVRAQAVVTIDNPRRWWPRMEKRPYEAVDTALYGVAISLSAGDTTVSTREAQIGLRKVELIQEADPDGKGRGFKFRVNGEDVFMKGANWIPADSFPARLQHDTFPPDNAAGHVDAEGNSYSPPFRYEDEYRDRVASLVRAAASAGFNMLRIWGGGLYESEHFYELCDELGILVWQDFPYACAYYPDTGEYADEAAREARAAIRRIRNHPCLALWCGNNENLTMFQGNWSGERPPRYLGENIYDKILPGVLKEEDPKTSYIPSSPQGGEDANSQDFGDRHNWDVWHGVGDWVHYAKDRSRFCSEFGFASSCGMETWDTCLAPADKWPQSPALRWHDKTRKGYETYFKLFTIHYPLPQTLEDLVYYSQINQAEALKFGIEHYRRLKGRCWGTLFWQINDCWPVQSWAVVDYLAVPKAAYYASRRFFSTVLISLFKVGDEVEAHLVSDLLIPIEGTATVTIETFDGEVLAKQEFAASVEANGVSLIGKIDLSGAKGKERESYVYASFKSQADGYTVGAHDGPEEFVSGWELAADNLLFLAEPKDLQVADPGVSFEVREEGSQCVISLQAKRLAPYVWIEIEQDAGTDRIQLSDNFFHLRPGETKYVQLARASGVRPSDVAGRIKIRTL
jgi:beta-mannosidase